jgi:hypothetical protein
MPQQLLTCQIGKSRRALKTPANQQMVIEANSSQKLRHAGRLKTPPFLTYLTAYAARRVIDALSLAPSLRHIVECDLALASSQQFECYSKSPLAAREKGVTDK